MPAEQDVKRARVRALLEADDDAIALRDPANLAWYLGGARVHVVGGVSDPICEVTVTAGADEVRTTVIEAPRLAAEELGRGAPPLRAVPWWEPLGPAAGASDRPRRGERDVSAGSARRPGRARARRGRALPRARPRDRRGDRRGAQGRRRRGERVRPRGPRRPRAPRPRHRPGRAARRRGGAAALHRHPLPTAAPLGARAMLVVVRPAARADLLRHADARVDAAAPRRARDLRGAARHRGRRVRRDPAGRPRSATSSARSPTPTPRTASPPDEWHQHHQGGPTGYAPRDYLASPASDARVADRQAFAWNPSGGGFKVEDTVLATAEGIEVLSPDPEWPAVAVGGRERPDVLV